jgi:hypothetical protein
VIKNNKKRQQVQINLIQITMRQHLGANAKAKEATVILPFHLQIALAQQPEVYSPPCNAGPITKIEMARAMFK